jgi:hypothetical protein
MTRQWFRFTFSRRDTQADKCAIDGALATFADSGYSLKELILGVTELEAFRKRLPVEEGVKP